MAPGQACWAVVVALLFLAYKSGSSAGPLPHRKGHALHRQEALALVAVLTGFDPRYFQRRQHARQTWFPSNTTELTRLHKDARLLLRFAIGDVPPELERDIQEEEEASGPFLRIPGKVGKASVQPATARVAQAVLTRAWAQDTYNSLTFKTVAFWQVAVKLFSVRYIIKVDDDSYVRLDRLAVAIGQWQAFGAEYVGCFKARDNTEGHLRLRTHRWYDPHHELFEGDASHYAEGAFYVVPGPVIEGIVKSGLVVRQGGPNEDVMTGWLMKAFNVSHFDDRRLCYKLYCDPTFIAFQWDHSVRDFLDPKWRKWSKTICCEDGACQDVTRRHQDGLACMHKVHTDPVCALPTLSSDGHLPMSKSTTYHRLDSDHEWIANPDIG